MVVNALGALPGTTFLGEFMAGREDKHRNALVEMQVQGSRNALAMQTGKMLAQGVLSAEDPATAYPLALRQAQQMGMDVSALPSEWGPEAEMFTRMVSMPDGEQTRVERLISQLKTPEERYKALQIELGMVPGAKVYAPIPGINPDGSYGVAVPYAGAGAAPGAAPVAPQGGFTPAEPAKSVDTGTGTQFVDPVTTQPRGSEIPRDVATPTRERMAAEAEAERAAGAPRAIEQAQETIRLIDEFVAHPGFDRVFGGYDTAFGEVPIPDALIPNIPGGKAAGAQVRLDQIRGKAFLEAFESLKGGGQITEREGQAAQAAMARLDQAQGPDEARGALAELRAIAERAITRAQSSQPSQQPAQQPQAPSFENLSDEQLMQLLGVP